MAKITDVLTQEKCTGCASCRNSCPRDAIQMKPNIEGFLCPEINEDMCVECGLCEKKCPVMHPQYINNDSPKCYAVWAKDRIREVSSSGGVFSVFADYILANNGDVVDVVYNENFTVHHILTNNPNDVEKIRGSKYIQSNVDEVYREIKQRLDSGCKVLFTGMPCQIAGLYAFLGENYSQLYTVELVCHGITSYKVFEKYMSDVFYGKKLTAIDFKKKIPWGWHAGINAEFSDGSVYRKPAEEDAYFQAYLNGISKNIACENCKFNRLPRQADVTIGDFWRISEFDKTLNDNKGTSLVLINNSHGEKLFNQIVEKLQRCIEVPLEYAIRGNGSLVKPYKTHFRRAKFFRELNDIQFQKLVTHCKENTFDVGIVGLWYGLNYGSILTYYALYCVVNQLGFDAIMVNKPDFIWRPIYTEPTTIANKFISKHCNVSNLHKYNEYQFLNRHCDTFIIGSDVVWNYEICGREAGNFFFLDFVDDSKKKIAYAASFGGSYNAPESERYMNQQYIKKFDAVSVREDAAVNICENFFGVNAKKVLDPVFLCDFNKFNEAADAANIIFDEPYIMTYILGGNDLQREFILHVSRELNIPSLINVVNPNNPTRVIENLKLEAVSQPSVEEWLWYMKHTEFFIGDSFHGLCFALIFKKQFIISISKHMPSKDRFITLLQLCGLENRLLYIEDDNCDKDYLLHEKINYDEVYRRLESYKIDSLNWLKMNLEKEKCNTICSQKERKDEWYYVAKATAENYHGRKIITWGNNDTFRKILQDEFALELAFWVAKNEILVDNNSVFPFASIKGKSDEYYLVIPDNAYREDDAKLLEEYGYRDGRDYIYRNHKPIVLTEGNYSNKEYFDVYGNSISGNLSGRFRITLRGFNNKVDIKGAIHTGALVIVDMNGNAAMEVGNNCRFAREFKIIFRGESGNPNSSKLIIRDNCLFDNGVINVWKCPKTRLRESQILINEGCTFGENFNCSVNSGNNIIIGRDCMLSYNISLQAGDGHSIFDVMTGKRINSITESSDDKNLIVLGEHVWLGKNSMILAGTNVGNGSIIGAGSVIKGNYPNNCTVVGNPGKIVKRNLAWSRNNALEALEGNEVLYSNFTSDANAPIAGRKVLVIGGTKFMGVELVNELIALGNNVTIATRGKRKDDFGNYVNRIIMDVSDAESVKTALSGKYYDVVFDNLAFSSNHVKNILSNVKCKRYIQLSSIAVYNFREPDMKEEGFEPKNRILKWCDKEVLNYGNGYGEGKQQAEIALYQEFSDVSAVTVRIPYVTKTDRLYYYCDCVINEKPMKIAELSRGFTFVRDTEVGRFLPWVAAQDYEGPINLSSEGMITLQMLIEYIEKKTGKKAVIDLENGIGSPFNEKTFSLNLDKAKELGYKTSNIHEWFWKLIDEYIERALKTK